MVFKNFAIKVGVLLLSILMAKAILASEPLSNLTPLEWQNRIILMDDVPQKAQWVSKLQKHDDQIIDRHIYWFVLSNPVITNYPGKLTNSFLNAVRSAYPFGNDSVL